MSDHTVALAPLASGYFQSPELLLQGRLADTGLLAEALIYYDRILVNVENPHQFANLISWLIQQGLSFDDLISLFREETLQIYNYSFTTNPYVDPTNGDFSIQGLYNIQDEAMLKPNAFEERFLGFEKLRLCFPDSKHFDQFCAALSGRVIDVKASEIGGVAINNALSDFVNPQRHTLIAQRLVNELYRAHAQGKAPAVQAVIEKKADGNHRIGWNFPSELLSLETKQKIERPMLLPLTGASEANKYIWSAAKLKCDLYLPRPISSVVGNKLYEANQVSPNPKAKPSDIIEQLEIKVEFPDLRRLVNENKIDFDKVLEVRRKAKKFREWLQEEADRDRDAIIAYHNEVAKELGFAKAARKSLRMFGCLGGAALGASIVHDHTLGAVAGAVVGEGAQEAVQYLFDLGASLGADWKPVVFGNWYKKRISQLLDEQ
jgi:hypothetical protein